jgi:hypothetical protein
MNAGQLNREEQVRRMYGHRKPHLIVSGRVFEMRWQPESRSFAHKDFSAPVHLFCGTQGGRLTYNIGENKHERYRSRTLFARCCTV